MGRSSESTIVVVSASTSSRTPPGVTEVCTPLDLIRTLEDQPAISTVMLADAFAYDRPFAAFVRESYPWLRLVIVMDRTSERSERATTLQLAYA